MRKRTKAAKYEWERARERAGHGASADLVAAYARAPELAKHFAGSTDPEFFRVLVTGARTVLQYKPPPPLSPSPEHVQYVADCAKEHRRTERRWGLLALVCFAVTAGMCAARIQADPAVLWLLAAILSYGAYCIGTHLGSTRFLKSRAMVQAAVIAAMALRYESNKTEYWRDLSWRDLELRVRDLFERLGYEAVATPRSNDRGVDVLARRGNEVIAVQCKQYSTPAQRNFVSELLGVVAAEKATSGILICTGGFTSDARSYARDHSIDLWDLQDLARQAEGTELPSCG